MDDLYLIVEFGRVKILLPSRGTYAGIDGDNACELGHVPGAHPHAVVDGGREFGVEIYIRPIAVIIELAVPYERDIGEDIPEIKHLAPAYMGKGEVRLKPFLPEIHKTPCDTLPVQYRGLYFLEIMMALRCRRAVRTVDALQDSGEPFIPDARRLRLTDADYPVDRRRGKMADKMSELPGKVLMDKENVQREKRFLNR